MPDEKKCPVCQGTIKGRTDKKFCSIQCKSSYQYENRQQTEAFYLQVDKHLKTNRKILKKFNKSGKSTVRTQVLHQLGFNPKFFTHFWKNAKGDVYLFVYEYGFLKVKEHQNDKYVLVFWQDYMNK
jgi:predicted nucleic acid-binding Zn ribbon protein